MLMVDAVTAMEEWSIQDDGTNIPPSLHFAGRKKSGSNRKQVEDPDSRDPTFDLKHGSWRDVPPDQIRMLKDFDAFWKKKNDDKVNPDDDDDWWEIPQGSSEFPEEEFEGKSWLGRLPWLQRLGFSLKRNKISPGMVKNWGDDNPWEEGERDEGEKEALLEANEGEVPGSPLLRGQVFRGPVKGRRNLGINNDRVSEDDQEGGPSSPHAFSVCYKDHETGQEKSIVLVSLEDLSPVAKAQLRSFKRQDFDERDLWKQRMAKVGGGFVGLGLAWAIGQAYFLSLDEVYAVVNYGDEYFTPDGLPIILLQEKYFRYIFCGDIFDLDSTYSIVLFTSLLYVPTAILFDAIPRNAGLWKKAINYLIEAGGSSLQKAWCILLIVFAVILPSLTEPMYFLSPNLQFFERDKNAINYGYPDAVRDLVIFGTIYGSFLFFDSLSSNADMLWGMGDGFREWASTTQSSLARRLLPQVLQHRSTSEEEPTRQDFQRRLDNTRRRLYQLPEDQIDIVYNVIYSSKEKLQEQFPDFEPELLETAQYFFVTRYLLSLGEETEEVKTKVQSRYKTLTDNFTYGCLILGSPFRYLVLENIVETILRLFCPSMVSQVLGWIGATIAFPFQTALEYQGMKSLFCDFLWHENPHGHSSYVGWRILTKILCLAQAAIFTVPIIALGLDTKEDWSLSILWLISAIPFFIPESAIQANNFNNTYNRTIMTGILDFHNHYTRRLFGCEPTSPSKRDRLIRLVEKNRDRIASLDPLILHHLKESLNIHEDPEPQMEGSDEEHFSSPEGDGDSAKTGWEYMIVDYTGEDENPVGTSNSSIKNSYPERSTSPDIPTFDELYGLTYDSYSNDSNNKKRKKKEKKEGRLTPPLVPEASPPKDDENGFRYLEEFSSSDNESED